MINSFWASIAVQALADAARKAGAEILRYRSARFSPVERASAESSTPPQRFSLVGNVEMI
jgi:hypothetical protein